MLCVYRYCRTLEENHFYARTADFLVMFIFGGILSIVRKLFCSISFIDCCDGVSNAVFKSRTYHDASLRVESK